MIEPKSMSIYGNGHCQQTLADEYQKCIDKSVYLAINVVW